MVNGAPVVPGGGRHPARAAAARTKAVLAVAGACMVIAAVILVSQAAKGPGARPPAPAAAFGGARTTPPARPAPTAPAKAATSSAARSPAARSSAPGLRQHQDPLGSAAAAYLSGRADTIQAAVYDVGTGQTWRLGQARPQAEASVVKLDVLETLLSEQGAAGLTENDQSLAQQMIEDSDNDAATSLWYAAGGAAGIRSFNAEAGLEDTAPSLCVDCPGFPWPGWGLTTTTAADQITLLRELVEPGRLLSGAARSYALSLMENVTPSQRWGISGGVPPQETVALKNGWLPLDSAATDWQINSVGWVSGDGRDYLMAVLTTGNPNEQYGIDTIDGLAALVWGEMRPPA
jgi:Beta-lactamase enzyme family